ncbi:MAG: bifunctional DNA primase/polymerase [Chloroflexi bacterium]|nr:bifunctional DNA primase/polymerase [Chloroflexota bacterium]
MSDEILRAALMYATDRGWCVTPVKGKVPILEGWQNKRLGVEDLPEQFNNGQNLGVLTGNPSKNLADVDLDARETLPIAARYLPQTDLMFGRPGKQNSHWLYNVAIKTRKFQDPLKPDKDEHQMIVEIRSTGCQTVFPPSVHTSGEKITFSKSRDPAKVDAQDLESAVSKLAAAALLARYWPGQGARQNAAMALASVLLKGGWKEDDATFFIQSVAIAAGDEEADMRLTAVSSTAKSLEAPEEKEITGWPTLAGLIDEKVLKKVHQWLGVKVQKATKRVQSDGRPKIDAGENDLKVITGDAWRVLQQMNNPVYLFRYASMAARLERNDHGAPVLRELTVDRVRHELARAALWVKVEAKAGAEVERKVLPPLPVCKDVLATPEPPLPVLTRVVEAPVFAPNGVLTTAPGYHPDARVYYAPNGLNLASVPEKPTDSDVVAAVGTINNDLLHDFPFADKSDKTAAVGLMLLIFARDLITGPTPLHLIEAPVQGSGKGLLADVFLYPALGRWLAAMAQAKDGDEWRKRLTAALLGGGAAVLIDNITNNLDSGELAAALTAYTWGDRILGKSENAQIQVRCAWIATANNPAMSGELARRSIRIRLDPKRDKPWERTGFTHEDLRGWVIANRDDLVWACLVLVQNWIAQGRPPGKHTLGSYESWARVIGGILEAAGVSGFLENMGTFYESADLEGTTWRRFVGAWYAQFGEEEVKTGDLYLLALECELPMGRGEERSQKTTLGKALARQRDRVWDSYQVLEGAKNQGARTFVLKKTVVNS